MLAATTGRSTGTVHSPVPPVLPQGRTALVVPPTPTPALIAALEDAAPLTLCAALPQESAVLPGAALAPTALLAARQHA